MPQALGGVTKPTHSTFPMPGKIRNDEHIRQVKERLNQLSENLSQGNEKKIKEGGAIDIYVNNRVKWFHEFILTGTNKEKKGHLRPTVPSAVDGGVLPDHKRPT